MSHVWKAAFIWSILISALTATVFAQPAMAQRRMIVLEISSDARSPVGTQQKWMEMLQKVGADKVVSRTGKSGTPTVEETRMTSSSLVKVTGFVVGGKLKLPGGSFSIRDTAGIRELLKRLREDGAKVALAEKKAFGLTSEQLVALHQQLAKNGRLQHDRAQRR